MACSGPTRRRRVCAAFAASVVALCVWMALPVAAAEPEEEKPPVELSADEVAVDLEANTAELSGNVELTRGDVSIHCDQVTARFSTFPNVTHVTGTGDVVAKVRGVTAMAPEVVVDFDKESAVFSGGVQIRRAEGTLNAQHAVVHLATGKVVLKKVKGKLKLPTKKK